MKTISYLVRAFRALVVVAVLSACSGGGGGDGGGGGSPDFSTAAGLSISPASLTFTAEQSGNLPPNQSIQATISASDAAIIVAGFPAGTAVPSWLNVVSITGAGNTRNINHTRSEQHLRGWHRDDG